MGLAPLSNEERDEVISDKEKDAAVRTVLDFTSGFWDDAMDLLQWAKDPSSAVDDCHQAVNAKVEEMQTFLSSVFNQLSSRSNSVCGQVQNPLLTLCTFFHSFQAC